MNSRVNMAGSESHLNLFHFHLETESLSQQAAHLMFPCQPFAETWDRLNPKVGSGTDKKESKGNAGSDCGGGLEAGCSSALQGWGEGAAGTRNGGWVSLVVPEFTASLVINYRLPLTHSLTNIWHSNQVFETHLYSLTLFKGSSCNLRASNQFISYSPEIKI